MEEWIDYQGLGEFGEDGTLSLPGLRYIAFQNPGDDPDRWLSEALECVSRVQEEAREVYGEHGIDGVQKRRLLIEEHAERQTECLEEAFLVIAGCELVAENILLAMCRLDSADGRLAEELAVVTRGGGVYDPDSGGPNVRPPRGRLVLRPHRPGGFVLEPTGECLAVAGLPTDADDYADFGVLVPPDVTWAEAAETLVEKHQEWQQKATRRNEKLALFQIRMAVYEDILERLASGVAMPWDEGEELFPTVRQCVGAVVAAAEEVDDLYRQRLLKWAASDLGVQGAAPFKKVEKKLREEDLYPVGDGSGRPGKERARELAEETLERCRAWLRTETK